MPSILTRYRSHKWLQRNPGWLSLQTYISELKVSLSYWVCTYKSLGPVPRGYMLLFFILSLRNGYFGVTGNKTSSAGFGQSDLVWFTSHKDCSVWDAFLSSCTFLVRMLRQNCIVPLWGFSCSLSSHCLQQCMLRLMINVAVYIAGLGWMSWAGSNVVISFFVLRSLGWWTAFQSLHWRNLFEHVTDLHFDLCKPGFPLRGDAIWGAYFVYFAGDDLFSFVPFSFSLVQKSPHLQSQG